MPEQAPHIDRKPSEYFLDGRCFVGVEPDERMLGYVAQTIGDRKLLYASDYYHWDCHFPHSASLLATRTDLGDESKRRILGENAATLYRL
jgi:hypothetical protein